jgi:iron complex outermembrane receptor protein
LVVEALSGVSFYVNKGESFRPIPQVRVDRTPIGAEDGEGIEYGLKTSLFDGRLSGTISIYDIDNKNGSTNLSAAIASELATAATAGAISAPPGGFNATDSQDIKSKGWEVEIQANIIDGWTATLNYSKNDTTVTNVAPGLRSLRSQLAAASYAGSTTQIDNFLNAIVDPTPNRGVRPEAMNFFTRYNFSSGRLKGAYIGAGAQWRSETLIDFAVPTGTPNNPDAIMAARRYYYLDSYTTFNALVGYNFRPRQGMTVNVALNVENLLDEEYINAFAAGFGQWGAPRTFVLTTTLNF